jgi:hypothetical protein
MDEAIKPAAATFCNSRLGSTTFSRATTQTPLG